MFLHSGASLHGHEYSTRPANQHLLPGPRRNPLLRSSYTSPNSGTSPSSSVSNASSSPATTALTSGTSSPASIIRASTISDSTRPARPLRPKPHLRHVSEGLLNSHRPPEPVVRFHDPVVVESPVTRSLSTTTRSPTPSRLRPRPKPQEPMSEDEASFSASEASYASDQASSSVASSKPHRRRRTPRKSTTFLFAHPAPKLSTKKQLLKRIRPTLLMQLQQLSPDRRPLPVIDVYPSSLIAGNVAAPRFSKRFPRLFGINGELGLHDTILVQSEDYDSQLVGSESEGEDDAFEHRVLLAVLSPLRRGDQSEIVLEDGTVWTTTPLPTGSFDFVRIDEHGYQTTARWVRRLVTRPPAVPAAGATASEDGAGPEPECKFTFSIIDPQSRRHPILATLTQSTLDILDRYTTVSPSSSSRYPPSRSWTQSPASHDADASNDEELSHDEESGQFAGPPLAPAMLPNSKARTTLPVDDALKSFISISAIWVSLQCGWGQSQIAAHGSASQCPVGLTNTTSGISKSGMGSVRFLPEQQTSELSNASESTDHRGRRLSSRSKARASTSTTLDAPDRDQSPSMSPRTILRTPLFPRKASSTGAAYMQRRKQLQISDTSDSERPALVAPRRRSRAFSRLSGEFSTSKVSSMFQQSPLPFEATATPEVTLAEISPSASLRQPTTSSTAAAPDLQAFTTPALPRGGRSVSAYYATNPLASPSEFAGAPDLYGPSSANLNEAGHVDSGIAWQQRPGSVLERSSNARWKKLGNWFKRLGGH